MGVFLEREVVSFAVLKAGLAGVPRKRTPAWVVQAGCVHRARPARTS